MQEPRDEFRRYRDFIKAFEKRLDWLGVKKQERPENGFIRAEYYATKHAIELFKKEQLKYDKRVVFMQNGFASK